MANQPSENSPLEEPVAVPDSHELDLLEIVETFSPDNFNMPLNVEAAVVPMALRVPSVFSPERLALQVSTVGWRFPRPMQLQSAEKPPRPAESDPRDVVPAAGTSRSRPSTKLRPPSDVVMFKDRLFYMLQPPLESLLANRQLRVPFSPYPYQLEGIAFLMPRQAALLADEMGLGKTMQTILALRLLFQAGLISRVLLVCPKPLVTNWCRELRIWAEDLPFEVIGGDLDARRTSWLLSNTPLKLVNYELLTRDAGFLDEAARFDVVVLDEAQRIKNRDAKTAKVARAIRRDRSWALTGTPIENHSEDLVNIFAFVDPGRIPADTPARRLPHLTSDKILRRTKEDVLTDLPSKTVREAAVELTPAQREAYERAETEGVIHLNALGETLTVQHVFELILRLKQICNFDPLTGESSKLERLQVDLTEIAESGRKAILFSQWVEPLEILARALAHLRPLQYHGRIPPRERQSILDRFCRDRELSVILMTYGTGSVGLNLQAANYVFLFDRWWNPAVEDQAINRVHRIGQKDPVFVTRFLTQGTIEERIAEILEKKRHLFNELLEQNDAPQAMGLSEEEIFGLFDIEARPRRNAA